MTNSTLGNEDDFLAAEDQELRDNNPYNYGYIFVFGDGDYIMERDTIQDFPRSVKDRYYTIKKDDSLWQIAEAAYGDSKWYWLIRDANDIELAVDLPIGKTIIIPDLTTAQLTFTNYGN